MRAKLPIVISILFTSLAVRTSADQLDMQNGDRYFGKVLSMSADTLVLESDVLGKVNVPRKKVASISLGVNSVSTKATALPHTLPSSAQTAAPTAQQTNLDLSASLRNLGANTNFIAQIRDQMLSTATPEAKQKYDQTVTGLMSGNLNMNDLRRQAKSSANQLRAMKKELGPEAGDSLDMYLEILDSFLKESGTENSATAASRSPIK
jgi:hypothetical protein